MALKRTVFRLRDNSAGTIDVDMFETATPNPQAFDEMAPHPLAFNPTNQDVIAFRDDPKGGGKTAVVGQALFDALRQHPALQLEASINQQAPIYVCEGSLRSQALPWEALAQGGDFLALRTDQRLARMVLSGDPASGAARPFEREFRVLALLAAAGADPNHPETNPLTAVKEFHALAQALAPLPAGLGLRVRVLGCDSDVQDAIQALGDQRFSFEFLLSSESNKALDGILAATEEMQPHVVHFFCHGQAGNPPQLELATRVDQEVGRAQGSVVLEPDDLARLLERAPGIWLAVLNCCLGATPTAESPGLAREMVHDGFPAAVGMQEPIDRPDAHGFSKAFYTGLRRALVAALAAPQPVPIDWPKLMIEPRLSLCRAHVGVVSKAEGTKVWTLPVLYVGRNSFELQVVPPPAPPAPVVAVAVPPPPAVGPAPVLPAAVPTPAEITGVQAELATLTSMRAELAAGAAPPAVLDKIDERLAQLRQRLSIP